VTTQGILLIVGFAALGSFVQTVTGFGGALVLAPVLFATMRPAQAVLLSAFLGIAQSGVLATRNRNEILRHELRSLLVYALPGLAIGVLVLRVATPSSLRVAVGASVIVATIARRALSPTRTVSRAVAGPVGFLAGLLTTSVTVNGPPLVLFLSARRATAAQMRGTLAAVFLALDVVGIAGIAVGGAFVGPPAGAIAAVAVSFPLGVLAGLWLSPRIPEHVYARSVTVLLVALGVSSIVAGLS
jgi:uncharacterized membrane protein YfcA